MNRFTIAIVATTTALSMGSAASALQVTEPGVFTDNTEGEVETSRDTYAKFDFNWDDAPASGYFQFTAENSFDAYFTSFIPRDNGANKTGWVLARADGTNRLTDNAADCTSEAVLAEIRGDCDAVTGIDSGEDAPSGAYLPDDENPVFSDVEAGTYYLGFYRSGSPSSGSLSFEIEETMAPIPLPAGGALLGGALLGFGALSRRRRQQA